jgi:hypothetical protein
MGLRIRISGVFELFACNIDWLRFAFTYPRNRFNCYRLELARVFAFRIETGKILY